MLNINANFHSQFRNRYISILSPHCRIVAYGTKTKGERQRGRQKRGT
jgi:hypothetical protein